MELDINGKKYELRYGLRSINALDNLYTQDMNGVEFGMGMEMLNAYLDLGRTTALLNAIKGGTSHLKSKPSNDDIENFLEDIAMSDEDKYEKLFDQLKEEIEQAPFLKRALQNMKNAEK